MKLNLGTLQPDAWPQSRGRAIIRATKRGAVVTSWPNFTKTSWPPISKLWRTRFGFAARMAANPQALEYLTAIEMTKGTEQVPRDVLTSAALGRYYIIINASDGMEWGHVEGPTAN